MGPESQAYMDLLAFERKLDSTIMRKRLDIQEALKRPMKQKRKLRIFISNTTFPAKEAPEGSSGEETSTTGWELRVEGRLLDEDKKTDPSKTKRKFSSFFKSLVIELDKDLYGPDNHLVEWLFAALFYCCSIITLSSSSSTRGWPGCLGCTPKQGLSSYLRSGSTSKPTSCRINMRRSLSTATHSSSRSSRRTG